MDCGWDCAKQIGYIGANYHTLADGDQCSVVHQPHPALVEEWQGGCEVVVSSDFDEAGGFDLEHTRLKHLERLEKLLLAVAIATLWRHELGEQVLENQYLHVELDPGGRKRELSIFQLDLRFLQRCLAIAVHRLPALKLRLSNLLLTPVLPRLPSAKFCQCISDDIYNPNNHTYRRAVISLRIRFAYCDIAYGPLNVLSAEGLAKDIPGGMPAPI